jgi:hypothetical protein
MQQDVFFSSQVLSKEEVYATLPARAHPIVSLPFKHLTPTHNPADNKTHNTHPDDPQTAKTNSSQKEASNPPDRRMHPTFICMPRPKQGTTYLYFHNCSIHETDFSLVEQLLKMTFLFI